MRKISYVINATFIAALSLNGSTQEMATSCIGLRVEVQTYEGAGASGEVLSENTLSSTSTSKAVVNDDKGWVRFKVQPELPVMVIANCDCYDQVYNCPFAATSAGLIPYFNLAFNASASFTCSLSTPWITSDVYSNQVATSILTWCVKKPEDREMVAQISNYVFAQATPYFQNTEGQLQVAADPLTRASVYCSSIGQANWCISINDILL